MPLKNGVIQHNDTFQFRKLERVDFVEEAELQDTIQALLCDKWRNDLQAEIDSIYQTLPNAYAVVHTYTYTQVKIMIWGKRRKLFEIGLRMCYAKLVTTNLSIAGY